jgi:hypothetical protein
MVATQYNFVWIIENDVFIPSFDAFAKMNELVETADLITSGHGIEENPNATHWNWRSIHFALPVPWYNAMSCAVGLSRRELAGVLDYAQRFRRLEYLEAMFNTIAAHSNLTVLTPDTLHSIRYRKDWTCQEIKEKPFNWFHPIKDQARFIGDCVLNGSWNLSAS